MNKTTSTKGSGFISGYSLKRFHFPTTEAMNIKRMNQRHEIKENAHDAIEDAIQMHVIPMLGLYSDSFVQARTIDIPTVEQAINGAHTITALYCLTSEYVIDATISMDMGVTERLRRISAVDFLTIPEVRNWKPRIVADLRKQVNAVHQLARVGHIQHTQELPIVSVLSKYIDLYSAVQTAASYAEKDNAQAVERLKAGKLPKGMPLIYGLSMDTGTKHMESSIVGRLLLKIWRTEDFKAPKARKTKK